MDTADFWKKKGIKIDDVIYITRNGRKSAIHLSNGETIECFTPIKNIVQCDTTNSLECINKGIVVNKKHIESVTGNNYTMSDGETFTGRVKTSQKALAVLKEEIISNKENKWDKYSLVKNMPLAFCIIELVFDDNGEGIDFIFRYCNDEMARLEGKPISEMIDKSFYNVFPNGDKKWLIAYADVALNGTSRVIESYSPEIDAKLRIYCFQPEQNYCACALVQL